MTSVVLASGGIDSAVATADRIEKYGAGEVLMLGIHYGSLHNGQELRAAQELARYFQCQFVGPWSMGFIGYHFRSGLIQEGQSLAGASTIVPVRNGIFTTIAAGYADSIGAKEVVIGCHGDDNAVYPDCRQANVDLLAEYVFNVTEGRVRVIAPLIQMTKRGLVAYGRTLGVPVPYQLTYSCYAGTMPACEACDACKGRAEALA